ncbi:ParB N-terminal domain-containing protein, partial [Salmonella enterica]|uniref:ParB N-terminal domain-containing protein n=1 Tax=Salmonella enterica TaxID=28901 RepID=UPI0039E8EE18
MQDKKVVEQQKTRPSIFTEEHRGEYYNLDIEKLISFRKQARRHFDEQSLNEMAATIVAHGIRQPLTVIANDSQPGNYEV